MTHKYLFVGITAGKSFYRHLFKTRLDGIKKLEKLLNRTNDEVEEIVYHGRKNHKQEFICSSGSRYLINRI